MYMSKADLFDKFKEATLGSEADSPLKAALAHTSAKGRPVDARFPVRPSVKPEKAGKNDSRELVSFHIDRDMKRLLGHVKFDTGRSYGELYGEAVEDLLRKYGKL